MAAGDDEAAPGHVRRRSTGAREHQGHYELETTGDGRMTQIAYLDSTGSRPEGTSMASGTDAGAHATAISAHDHAARTVRFSQDGERDLTPQRSLSDSGPAGRGQSSNNLGTKRLKPTELTLDTRQDDRRRSEGFQMCSPPISPPMMSPSSRNRGYSMRRLLFQRHIAETGLDGHGIELQEGASSSSVISSTLVASTPNTPSKKDGDTTITISPVGEFDKSVKESKSNARGSIGLPYYESWLERQKKSGYMYRLKTGYQKARKIVLRKQEIPPSKDGRHVPLDASRRKPLIDERTNKEYVNNFIRSCRYTVWNFVPRQLFAQFSKLANFYFLTISILQLIPGLSTTGTFTTIVPLMFFVIVSMAKEGYDDYRRYKLDKAENNREVEVFRAYKSAGEHGGKPRRSASTDDLSDNCESFHWARIKWYDLRVGDIVKLIRDDSAPADLLLLHSSSENNIAYIETMALDGETNLKSKQTTATLAEACNTTEKLATCSAMFVGEDPNLDLYKFEGRVTVNGETSPLTNNEIIYRNSILRNTPEAIGMVLYSGEECKIRMNANKNPRIKAPHLQSLVNRIVVMMVVFVLALAIFNTVAYRVWRSYERTAFYLYRASVTFVQTLVAFIIMFNTLIPLSLYVSMEIIKLIQMYLMNDIDMYDPKTDTPFRAQTSTINEELGQISYVFSDKTGTLTDNEMKFRKISVAGVAWLHDYDLKIETKEPLKHKKRDKGKKRRCSSTIMTQERRVSVLENSIGLSGGSVEQDGTSTTEPRWHSSARPAKQQRELRTKDLIRYIQMRPHTTFARKARMFLLSIALCHTCLPETQSDGTKDFQAASPDELALVRAAQELGFLIVNRTINTITLRYKQSRDSDDEVEELYEVLDVIEFSSKRKRMSVLVRFPNRRVCIITKGADSVIMTRLKLATFASKMAEEIEERTSKRKSLEAQVAMVRKSSVQLERNGSLSQSMSLGRTSMQRGSMTGQRMQPIRDNLDHWLRQREHEVDMSGVVDSTDHMYSPRASGQIGGRPSMGRRQSSANDRFSFAGRHSVAFSDAPSSTQWDEDFELVDEGLVNDEPQVVERCFQHINDFATEGLRTLLYGFRFLSDGEYASWKKMYLEATTSIHDRERKIEQAGELVEVDLDLGGATAIEDKLQAGVPETIDKLRRANMKMWMLTGDKRETAINIGHSCRLIKDYSTVVIIDHETGEVERTIGSALVSVSSGSIAHSVAVVDGQTLTMIEGNEALERLFFDLAIVCDSVICCRASPSQKARLVKGIRNRVKNSITLAIGDGANDIAMIQTAHVGIGITGKEGLQAARTSDYAIAQFRFLSKLLLVHGRWNYIRTCKYILGTFWKEMLFYLTQALYQRWNGYTGTSLYESWSLSMFNTLFTSLPVIFLGAFDKDLLPSTLLAVPELYTKGQKDGGFNFKIFLGWIFMAASEAMIVYFCMYALWGMAIFNEDDTLFSMGDMTFSACVIIISTKLLALEMHNKSIIVLIGMFLSIGGWFLWNIVLSATYHSNQIYKVKDSFFHTFGKSIYWWLTLILIILSVVILELGVSSIRAAYFPSDADIFQAFEQDLAIRRRFEEASAIELQQGWDHGKKKTSLEIQMEEEAERKRAIEAENEEERREEEIRHILRTRPDKLTTIVTASEEVDQEEGGKRWKGNNSASKHA